MTLPGALFLVLGLTVVQGPDPGPVVRAEIIEVAPCRLDAEDFAVSIALRAAYAGLPHETRPDAAGTGRVAVALVRETIAGNDEPWMQFADPLFEAAREQGIGTVAGSAGTPAAPEVTRHSQSTGQVIVRLPLTTTTGASSDALWPGDYDVRLGMVLDGAGPAAGPATPPLAWSQVLRVHLPDPSSAQECAGTSAVLAPR